MAAEVTGKAQERKAQMWSRAKSVFPRHTRPWTARLLGAILVVVVSKSQWQHYLPQVYLKGFATQPEKCGGTTALTVP
jgi:hypothetical protein